jgi:hypothetical protein
LQNENAFGVDRQERSQDSKSLPNHTPSYNIILQNSCPYYRGLRACPAISILPKASFLNGVLTVLAKGMLQADDISNGPLGADRSRPFPFSQATLLEIYPRGKG